MNVRGFFIRQNSFIACGLAMVVGSSAGLHYYRASGERRYPACTLEKLPRASVIRTMFEEQNVPTNPTRTCTAQQPVLVASPGGSRNDELQRWLPTFVALSYIMPRAELERYAVTRLKLQLKPGERIDVQTLMYAAATAYLDAIPRRPEVKLRLRESEVSKIPLLDARTALYPGTYLWKFNALGHWHYVPDHSPLLAAAVSPAALHLVDVDHGSFEPPCAVATNITQVGDTNESAGALLHWRFDRLVDPRLVEFVDAAASYGYPWRFMIGGFHELIVEDLPGERNEIGEELVKITYALTEVYELHPLGQKEQDKKIIPKWKLVGDQL
jgi:hypothetical protein